MPTGVRHPIAISGESTPRHFSLPKSSSDNPPIEASFQPVLPGQKSISISTNRPAFALSPPPKRRMPYPKFLPSSRGLPAESLTPFLVARRIKPTKITNTSDRALSNVPQSTGSYRFEISGLAGSSDPFSSRMSASVLSFFQIGPNASGVQQS